MTIERGLNDAALDAATAAVHQPHFRQPCCHRGIHVLVDDRRDIARREGVKIKFGPDWNVVRVHGRYELRSTKYEVSTEVGTRFERLRRSSFVVRASPLTRAHFS